MKTSTSLSVFAKDTVHGLRSTPKTLHPKYFYDDRGSKLFQDIMRMPEYYLTDCELEIFSRQAPLMGNVIMGNGNVFQLIELGPGDGLKSKILLNSLRAVQKQFEYVPIDISVSALSNLVADLATNLPGLMVKEKAGDYFDILEKLSLDDQIPRVILFLGGNIGNFNTDELEDFLRRLSLICKPGDKLLMGFDLKKLPKVILAAYDDPHGLTRDFNLNHLARINRELEADFDPQNFVHHASYNPITGEAKSYLVSKSNQTVNLSALDIKIPFNAWEPLYMEVSRKYDVSDIEKLAAAFGFRVEMNFNDSRKYFTDSLWVKAS